MTLAAKCHAIRCYYNFSQRKLAEILGITQTAVSFIENGFIPRQAETIAKIDNMWRDIQ
jgi:transcriptional regulator with XRE-family HTH domain